MSYHNALMCESATPRVELINALCYRTEAIPSLGEQCDGSAPFVVAVACILASCKSVASN